MAPIIYVVAAIGAILFVTKPKVFDHGSKVAATSTATTTALVDANTLRGAFAAASVVKIGEANSLAPDSPSKAFIAAEIPVALASLPPPDPTALIEAERRKAAVLAGKLDLVSSLYDQALKKADANAQVAAKALTAKRASDLQLEQEAAERLGAERLSRWLVLLAVVAVGLYLYVKLTHLSPGALATVVTDLRAQAAGTATPENPAIHALDASTTRLQQWMVSTLAKLRTKL